MVVVVTTSTVAANNPQIPAPLNQIKPESQADWQQILNQLSTWQSTLAILVPAIQQTDAERVSGVVPTNYAYAPGDVRRYGADPTGVSDSSAAWTAAVSCNAYVFDGYPGGGSYLFSTQVSVPRSPIRISGAAAPAVGIGAPTAGTRITLQASAGAGAAAFVFSTGAIAPYMGVTIENICFLWQTITLAQYGILATVDFRNFSIRDCALMNVGAVASPGVVGISLQTSGAYTGDGSIRDCYISALKWSIQLTGNVTTVKVRDCILFGNGIGTNDGIHNTSSFGGMSFIGNTIEGMVGSGINSISGGCLQMINYFEGNGADFSWGSSTNNISIGDFNPSGGTASYNYNNTSANIVLGAAGYGIFIDSQNINIARGILDRFGNGVYQPYGQWQSISFSAGNFSANGTQTWTVSSGNVSLEEYSVIGNTMLLHLEVDGSSIGGAPNTQLNFAMPLAAKTSSAFPCEVRNNGTRQMGVCLTTANSTSLAIFVDITRAANWAASASNAGVSINIAVRVNA